jgi:hypothetical protein
MYVASLIVDLALQVLVIHCHVCNSNHKIQLRDFPTAEPSWMTTNASRPEQVDWYKHKY